MVAEILFSPDTLKQMNSNSLCGSIMSILMFLRGHSLTNPTDLIEGPNLFWLVHSGHRLWGEGGGRDPALGVRVTWWKVWNQGRDADEHESTGRERWRRWSTKADWRSVKGVDLRRDNYGQMELLTHSRHHILRTFIGFWVWNLRFESLSDEFWRIFSVTFGMEKLMHKDIVFQNVYIILALFISSWT